MRRYVFSSGAVPGPFEGFRIAFLADIHHRRSFPLGLLKKLVSMTNGLKPDLILLGGDYVD